VLPATVADLRVPLDTAADQGLAVQAIALALIAIGHGFVIWAIGAIGLGIGTAMAYPTLLAAVGDVAHPA
jgi:hypothetical protein